MTTYLRCNQCSNFHPKKFQTCWQNGTFLNDKRVEEDVSWYEAKWMMIHHFLWNLNNIVPTCISIGPTIAECSSVISIKPYSHTYAPNKQLLLIRQILLQLLMYDRSIVSELLSLWWYIHLLCFDNGFLFGWNNSKNYWIFTCYLASAYFNSYTKVIVLFVSNDPKYQACVFPLPMTLSETNDFPLFKEAQWPKAPFMVTSLEQ